MRACPDDWKLTQYKDNDSDQKWFFRKNMGVEKMVGKAEFSMLIYFTVKYVVVNSFGLPSKKDHEILYDFDENIIPKLEIEASCIYVASVLKNGIKDHLIYVSDSEHFMQTIKKYIPALSMLDISFEEVLDPSWDHYNEFP